MATVTFDDPLVLLAPDRTVVKDVLIRASTWTWDNGNGVVPSIEMERSQELNQELDEAEES